MVTDGAPPSLKLYDWSVSPFCMKVRAVLDHKQLAYQRLPALAHRRELTRRGGVGKVPALDIDGALVVDSTDIVHELERRFPDRPVLPAAPRERARCHVLEDWADESLYFFGLYYHWEEPAGRRAARAYFARTLLGRIAFVPYLARIRRQLWGHGLSRRSPAQVRADLERNLDAADALLADGDTLLSGGPWLCDYALGAQLLYLMRAPGSAPLVGARPRLVALVERMKGWRRAGPDEQESAPAMGAARAAT